ncbi:phage tail protein [filamentous cyanobacterium LEGE 11480]|uniref:Phage tail protein n=1 Tax=Romeriopsis navalis LEGE 11480 TaxID=2777977 RepID=A0A928VPK8_9CYAN|nr:phage tail protein [Romeriopsis navalis]MBE9031478.1 phage tail protein [Romeriopsis navalis LEGE 11480]
MSEIPIRPITTSRFYVEFDGLTEKLIKSVQEVAFQGQVKGNEKPLATTKGGKTIRQSTSTGFEENPNFTIEVYLREGDMEFYNWMQDTMPSSYSAGSAAAGKGKWSENRKNGSIVAYDPGDKEILRWNIKNAWIKTYKISDLAADGSDLAVETFEIVCEDIRRVPTG